MNGRICLTYRSLLIALAAPSMLIDLMWGFEGLLEKVLFVYRFVRDVIVMVCVATCERYFARLLRATFSSS